MLHGMDAGLLVHDLRFGSMTVPRHGQPAAISLGSIGLPCPVAKHQTTSLLTGRRCPGGLR
jgi:hypothetical protein